MSERRGRDAETGESVSTPSRRSSVEESSSKQPLLMNIDINDNNNDNNNNVIAVDNVTELSSSTTKTSKPSSSTTYHKISKMGFRVLVLLAVQNSSKNILMRYVMKDKPKFLTSAAILGVELLKLFFCGTWILLVERASLGSIVDFLKSDMKSSLLLLVPAAAYNLQMTLEYVAMANIDAALFSAVCQTKLLATASFSVVILKRRLRKIELVSLVLLTCGVMLCNLKKMGSNNTAMSASNNSAGGSNGGGEVTTERETIKGIMATLGIAVSSGLASVYTEKVIKTHRNDKATSRHDSMDTSSGSTSEPKTYGLAYIQIQLALVSLGTMGAYAAIMDYQAIMENGLWYNFNIPAYISIFASALGGLTVAAVLKYADSVLKGYATAISVVMTGILSMLFFGTQLNIIYGLGIINVVLAVLLYNSKDLDHYIC